MAAGKIGGFFTDLVQTVFSGAQGLLQTDAVKAIGQGTAARIGEGYTKDAGGLGQNYDPTGSGAGKDAKKDEETKPETFTKEWWSKNWWMVAVPVVALFTWFLWPKRNKKRKR